MKKINFFIKAFSLIIVFIIAFSSPSFSLDSNFNQEINMNSLTIFSELKYEVKEKTSLENPVIDPNFNVMRNKEMNRFPAIILVGGILLVAVAAPLATWWFFSK